MSYYIGIDLGTTNSAICSYDGQETCVWKSPEQNDVTPSAIFIDKRGNRYYGNRAYDNAPKNPGNSATLFKRFMGTSTKIELKGAGVTMTPEECSAEILKILYGYLPEEIRNDQETAVVITVPAAFNQMKKDATLEAAHLAGFNKVALMQEPVAAVMSIMKHTKAEGIFLVYDLGGGTFDISIAENIGGTVNLLAHGGVEMCGGRDIDRSIFNTIIVPWLKENFTLPDDFLANPKYRMLINLSQWAVEKAKIELSSKEDAIITLSESESRTIDEEGEEIYIDIPLTRSQIDVLLEDIKTETVKASRETMSKAGLTANDIERIIFVGGPTHYKPLRDAVCAELSLKTDLSVNPMTAVAEGASIFAESIDWKNISHNRKAKNKEEKTEFDLSFKYTARTPDDSTKIVFFTATNTNYTVEIISNDTGWTSGRAQVHDRSAITLPLTKQGDNTFSISIYDAFGQALHLEDSTIVVTKTIASVGAIPASQSIGVEVLNSLGGATVLDFLIKEGESLPKKGTLSLKAGESLQAGSNASINIKLWEGNIESPVVDNRFIGILKISGTDFDSGVISTGSEIVVDYEIGDSGALALEISVPSIGATFQNKNFYSRAEGQQTTLDTDKIADDATDILSRIESMESDVEDERLTAAKKKVQNASTIGSSYATNEEVQEASNNILEAKKTLYEVRKDHLAEIRQSELDGCYQFFNDTVRRYAKPTEEEAYDKLVETAQRAIDRNEPDFENILSSLRSKNFDILWRQDWFVVDRFRYMVQFPYNYSDRAKFNALRMQGEAYVKSGDIENVRKTIYALWSIEIRETSYEDMMTKTNIVRG